MIYNKVTDALYSGLLGPDLVKKGLMYYDYEHYIVIIRHTTSTAEGVRNVDDLIAVIPELAHLRNSIRVVIEQLP